jgi:hypothetical protein
VADRVCGLKAAIVAVVMLLLPSVGLAAGEEPAGQPEARPVLGVVMMLTDIMRAENNAKPTDMFNAALNEKAAQKAGYAVQHLDGADFKTFLGKKDIVPDSVGLLRELKLAQLVEYGKGKNVDFLLVVIGDAKVTSHMQTHFDNFKDDKGRTTTHSYETHEVDYADVTLRAAYVDVRKGEYVQNYTVERRSGRPAVFGNAVRSVVNDGSTRALDDFRSKFAL